MTRRKGDPEKAAYEAARRRAMQELARRHRREYLALIADILGRPIDTKYSVGLGRETSS